EENKTKEKKKGKVTAKEAEKGEQGKRREKQEKRTKPKGAEEKTNVNKREVRKDEKENTPG
ncbi:hypothetical protein DOS62_11730, partial [Staphylococcus felis]|uniref:hypothetical protein n=1 Tax=Staphylococcus felis TaxID=46127 RepID=UPI000E39B2A9